MKYLHGQRMLATIVLIVLAGGLVFPISAQAPDSFADSFDDPSLPGWDHSPEVSVVDGVLHVPALGFAFLPGEWHDLALSVQVRLVGEGEVVIRYRATEDSNYHVLIGPGYIVLFREEHGAITEMGAVGALDHPVTEWFQLGVTVTGEQHVITLNGTALLTATDPAPLPSGGVSFHAVGMVVGEFDDLTITANGDTAAPVIGAPPATNGEPAYLAESWVRLGGPPGGLGYDIRMRPDNPDVMFVTDAHAGVHKSTDGGLTWFPSNNGMLEAASNEFTVFCLTIDPHNYDIIWAGTQHFGHLYRSADNGATWELRDTGRLTEGRSLRGITVDPVDANVVYVALEVDDWAWRQETGRTDGPEAGTRGEVYKSTDGGMNWTLIWDGDNLARYVWIDPRNTDRVYVSTGIFDRAAANGELLEPGAGVGILRSDDGGQTWTVLGHANGLRGLFIPSLFMHPTNPDILFAAVMGDLDPGYEPGAAYVTTNGGDTWTRLDAVHSIHAVEISTSDPDIWYGAGEGVFWRSEDAGQTWQSFRLATPDRDAGMPIDLQVDPRDPYRIFDNNYGGGNFLSEDGGATWTDASHGYTGAAIPDVMVGPGDGSIVFASANTGGFRSTDGGQTWYGLSTSEGTTPPHFVRVSDTHLVGSSVGDFLYSTDGGDIWQSVSVLNEQAEIAAGRIPTEGYEMRALAVAPADAQIMYTGFTHETCPDQVDICLEYTPGFFRSQDGGLTWQQNPTPFDGYAILTIAVHPTDSRTLLAGTANGLYTSHDGGDTWSENTALTGAAMQDPTLDPDFTTTGLQKPFVVDLLFDPFDAQTIYAATIPGVVMRSRDGGATWTQVAAGLDPNERSTRLVADTTQPGVLYLGTERSGAHYSTDGADSWLSLNTGLETNAVRSLALSDSGNVLYAGSSFAGVFRLGTP